MAKTLLLGLGNSILRDDAAGLRVVRKLGERICRDDVDVLEASFANIELLEAISPYDRLIVVDSIKTEGGRPGDLYQIEVEDLRSTLHLSCPHDINLATALELGKRLGMSIPKEIRIYGIEVEDTQTFSECCSPSVEEAFLQIVEDIAQAEQFKFETRNPKFETNSNFPNPKLRSSGLEPLNP